MDGLAKQTIELYAKLLRVPTFKQYEDIVRQLDKDAGYADFLAEVMKLEYDTRQDSARRRAVKAAKFPYLKTFDELELSRFEHVDSAYLKELASCEFVRQRKNIVMIGNPGTGKTHLSIALGILHLPEQLSDHRWTGGVLRLRWCGGCCEKRCRSHQSTGHSWQ